ncbi:MAG: hypothetical protein KAT06_11790 [Gammaproteobacteria bacterium]|nr:hypothetical protein [Gammaproteobacteria bacterium]
MTLTSIKKFGKSIDTEMQQALVRVAILVWGLIFFSIGLYFDYYQISTRSFMLYFGLFSIFSIVLAFSIKHWPNISWRLYLTVTVDIVFISMGLVFTGDITSPFFILYLWVLISQALRFGKQLLYTAQAISFLCYGIIVVYLGDFSEHPIEITFLLLSLIIVPLHLNKLLSLLHQARMEADAANETKSMFLANMSHELRTPLNAIIGYSEILKDEADSLGYKSYSKDLGKIRNAGHYLLALINSILDFSKAEAGKTEVDYSFVNIKKLLTEISETIIPLTKKQNNILNINCPDNMGGFYLDKTKITQTLFNLLSNASKFTDNGNIDITVSLDNNTDVAWLYFSVKDTGMGIPKEKFKILFQPFTQVTASTTRTHGGTGLGLTISKHFVSLMNGTIEVESTVGKGTTFTIKLPAYTKNPEAI